MNPDYDLVIADFIYTIHAISQFGIDDDNNLVIQFLIFIQPNMQQPQILYQLETVPVPVIDQNTQVQSYMQLQVDKPYMLKF